MDPAAKAKTLPPLSKFKHTFAGVTILIAVGCLVIGFVLGRSNLFNLQSPAAPNITNIPQKPDPNLIKTSPLFTTQSAFIIGKVTKVESNKLTIENYNKQSESFKMAENFQVITTSHNGRTASHSADLTSIPLNQEASILLQVDQGEYKVVNVSYNQPSPPQR